MVKTLEQAQIQKEKELHSSSTLKPKPKSSVSKSKSKSKSSRHEPKSIVQGTKRHGHVKRTHIPTAIIKKIARRAKVKRMAKDVPAYMRKCIESYMTLVLRTALMYTKHDHNRKTISGRDIIRSVKDSTGTRYLGRCEPRKVIVRKK